jgi:hypothetical protein
MHTALDEEECRLEYAKNWIKARLYGYLLGRGNHPSMEHDVPRAITFGLSRAIFQIIVESLPSDGASDRFRDILTILRKTCASPRTGRPEVRY